MDEFWKWLSDFRNREFVSGIMAGLGMFISIMTIFVGLGYMIHKDLSADKQIKKMEAETKLLETQMKAVESHK